MYLRFEELCSNAKKTEKESYVIQKPGTVQTWLQNPSDPLFGRARPQDAARGNCN
jgi:hypothetical protein